jgi:DNA primase
MQKEPKTSGKSLQIQCPYHGNGLEKKPSAGIRKSDGMFHCFACNEIHTLPEVISHCFGHDDMGAFGWQWLMKNFATVQKEERKGLELDFLRTTNNRAVVNTYISEEELDSYRYTHPYMYKRKLTDAVIDLFDIVYDKKTQCITFPIRDVKGHTLFIARRSVNSKFFNYPSGVIKPVYGIYELGTLKNYPSTIFICESMIDALTIWGYGDYAVALNGLGNDLQFKQLNAMPCREFVLATDNDDAGRSARQRIRKHIKNKIIKEVVFPSDKKDINDLSKLEYQQLPIIF